MFFSTAIAILSAPSGTSRRSQEVFIVFFLTAIAVLSVLGGLAVW